VYGGAAQMTIEGQLGLSEMSSDVGFLRCGVPEGACWVS
jgi:hypothetical protein